MGLKFSREDVGIAVITIALFFVVLKASYHLDDKEMSAVSAAGTVAAAWAAVWAIYEIRSDRRSRNEPFVLFDIEATNNGIYWMVLENLGAGIAQSVELAFDPVPIDYEGRPINERPLLQHPIPMIAPGKRMMMFFHTNPFLYQRDVPRAFQVIVKYTGEGGFKDERVYRFDFNKHLGQAFPPKTTSEELHELNKHAKQLAEAISRHSPLSGGLLVEEWSAHEKRIEEQIQERRAPRDDDADETSQP